MTLAPTSIRLVVSQHDDSRELGNPRSINLTSVQVAAPVSPAYGGRRRAEAGGP